MVPHLLDLLLGHVIRWVIVMIVAATLETVLSFKDDWLLIVSVETRKR
jgi:hypothetical protein